MERFARGVEEAARQRGIFHFCLHPENLAEHPWGLSLLDDCLAALVKVRDRGDVEVLTVEEVARRAGQMKEPERVKAGRFVASDASRAVGTAPSSGD